MPGLICVQVFDLYMHLEFFIEVDFYKEKPSGGVFGFGD